MPASSRSSRPTPTATGRSRSPGRCRRRRRRASASRRSTRRSCCATAGIRRPILVLYPIPPDAGRGGRPARRSSVAVGAPGRLDADLLAAARRPTASVARPARSSSRSRPGLGPGGALPEDGSSAAAADPCGRRRARSSGALDAPPGGRGRGDTARQVAAVRGRASRRCGRRGDRRCPRRHLAASGGSSLGDAPALRRASGRACHATGSPRRARRGRRSARTRPGRRRAAAAGHVAPRPAGPGRGAAGRPGVSLRPDLRDAAAEPDRDAAARLRRRLAAVALEPGRARSSAASGSRSSATWRWTP